MSKLTKAVSLILGLLALSLLGLLIVLLGSGESWGSEWSWLPKIAVRDVLQHSILAHYYFWTSIGCFLLVLLGLVLVFISPRRYSQLTLKEENGRLLLTKGAIEGYVKTLAQTGGYLSDPKVKVALYKKKVKVDVHGETTSNRDALEKMEELSSAIRVGLLDFFGLDRPLDFQVRVHRIASPKTASRPRVE